MEKRTETFAIDGMTCGSCVRHVRSALAAIDGLELGEIVIGTAEVRYDPAILDRNTIVGVIREEGYGVR